MVGVECIVSCVESLIDIRFRGGVDVVDCLGRSSAFL